VAKLKKLKKYIIIGLDGRYTEVSYQIASSPAEVRDRVLKDIADGNEGNFEPAFYEIREVVGRVFYVGYQEVEKAHETAAEKQQKLRDDACEADALKQYEALKKRFEPST
jgi:hypothetical protein